MGIRFSMLTIGTLSMIGAMSTAPMEPGVEAESGSARNRPSGSKPVAGGGARERARRLARMSETKESN